MSGQTRVMQADIRSIQQPAPSSVSFPNGAYGNILNRDKTPVTSSAINGAQTNGEYTFRAPSPPHIHIPQTNDDHHFVLNGAGNTGYSDEDEAILARATAAQASMVTTKDWKYEWRRKSQPILTFLHLGPSSSARDLETLRAEGITLLLVIRNTMTAQASLLSGDKVARQLGIQSAAVDVAGNQELIAAFPRATKIINDHLIAAYRALAHLDDSQNGRTTWGKILVFCESGNERSAAVITAYLMQMFDLDMVSAIQYVQSQRFCVAFDDGLKNLLQAYDDILGAKRSVSRASSAAPPQPVAPAGKRRRDDVDNDDEDMDMGDMNTTHKDDVARFSGRSAFAPFLDV
ncbi:related to protein tyrosine phosphatase [Phialocephala subalpina]|uniref:Related to protein tyrosine phosphatase n=1 Tax=Phialocephala subalpina TaxID=576137 RepID=A0A1L7XB74_9HELO|nr:related to protein tyrosine phosphatase [Phialocephala subalpina]